MFFFLWKQKGKKEMEPYELENGIVELKILYEAFFIVD